MKTNNHIKAGVLFFMFCSLFFFSCSDIFQPPKPEKPAEGTGYLSLSIDGVQTGRTILPIKENNVFAGYALKFTPADNKIEPFTKYWNKDTTSGTIPLYAGTYDLKVTAYMNEDYTNSAAEGNASIEITAGGNTGKTLTLKAIIEDGAGTFSWNIDYPDVTPNTASMTITPLNDGGTKEQTLYFIGGVPLYGAVHSITLNAGYYRVVIKLSRIKDGIEETAELREILHVYRNRESHLDHLFEDSRFTGALFVTNGDNGGDGSLRWAIEKAIDREGGTIIIDRGVDAITLTESLTINYFDDVFINITIEGNGVTITQSSMEDHLLRVFSTTPYVSRITIRRVHFKGGKAVNNRENDGGAIFNRAATLILESCIFSENQAQNGGAIYNNGNMEIKGCTFYGNSAAYKGGAIYNDYWPLFLIGNLFSINTAPDHSVINNDGALVVSCGCNVVDVPIAQSGLSIPTDPPFDTYIPDLDLIDFFPDENAYVIDFTDDRYPTADFYGYPIQATAAAGAVQRR